MNLPQTTIEDVEAIEPPSKWKLSSRGFIAILTVIGMLYLSGGLQYWRFRLTPTAANEPVAASAINEAQLLLPATIWVLRSDQAGGSGRNQTEIDHLVQNSNNILQQANIQVAVQQKIELPITASEMVQFRQTPQLFVRELEQYDPTTINIFLVKAIGGGINGLALNNINSVIVSDFTSVYDYRTLAHEIGHILGLNHVDRDASRLMYRGANGIELTPLEVQQIRLQANKFLLLQSTPLKSLGP